MKKVNKFLGITIVTQFLLFSFFIFSNTAKAYGECDQYGYMATYDSYSGTCSCMSGYSFGKDFLGNTSCISDDQLCKDQYGYNARSDYLTDKCKCGYGYAFGKDLYGDTQCVSLDSICTDKLGFNSRYNSLDDSCECSYGYVISGGRCIYGDTSCSSDHGIYSSYDSSSNSCECDDGYTLDDYNQCVKKQNNVYFTVKEIDTDEKKAIIRSDYDSKHYLITYNYGCYATSFRRYLNKKIVVNLGTDFYLDTWDKIVLQDDNETCDITRKEYADSSTTLEPEEEGYFDSTPYIPQPTIKTPEVPKQPPPLLLSKIKDETNETDTISASATEKTISNSLATTSSPKTEVTEKSNSFFVRLGSWFKNLFK
jgi:hypothetical protein